ncbi:MAG: orotidine-5'-phosphate decarboxylase [Anaerovoracaceae bacterium]
MKGAVRYMRKTNSKESVAQLERQDVIIALDFSSKEETLNFLENFKEEKPFVKIGMELFYAEGPEITREIKKKGFKIFLDLKLHDIPNTVGNAMKVLGNLDIDMCNLHASGGSEMMKKAVIALKEGRDNPPLIIAVTQLTSTSEELMKRELLIENSLETVVIEYAKNAMESGLDGVVCSPLEAAKVKEVCGEKFLTVTPGIRYGSSDDDQVRITNPKKARELGSDFIVVGRPITKAEEPLQMYKKCKNDFLGEDRK